MATDSRTPANTEARLKKKALQLVEGQKATADYEAGLRAMREKTARLRALRLARDAEESKQASENPAKPAKKVGKKSASGR